MINKLILSGRVVRKPEFFPLGNFYLVGIVSNCTFRKAEGKIESIPAEINLHVPSFLKPLSLGAGDTIYVEASYVPSCSLAKDQVEPVLWCNVVHITSTAQKLATAV